MYAAKADLDAGAARCTPHRRSRLVPSLVGSISASLLVHHSPALTVWG